MALGEIIGQDRALRILLGTLKRNRVPSSVLLSGDSGIGKRLAAINYAKAVNCLEPVDFDCCDKCMSCKKIDSEMHPDISMIVPENDVITIETIRNTQEVISLKPYEGRKKVLIVDDADAMNIYAANAFLKTLEEPPEDSLIILISSNPERLPDTIRSRCVNVRFYPLPVDGCREVVLKKGDFANINFILNLSMGRPGLAVSRDFIKENEWFAKLLNNMIHGESKDSWGDKGEIRAWLDMAFILLRDMAVYKITGSEKDLMLKGQGSKVKGQEIKSILNAYQDMQQVRGLLDFNLNKSITWNYVASIMRRVMEV
ncbi:MAG: ATP-binding protein [Nitrospirota bacterium]